MKVVIHNHLPKRPTRDAEEGQNPDERDIKNTVRKMGMRGMPTKALQEMKKLHAGNKTFQSKAIHAAAEFELATRKNGD